MGGALIGDAGVSRSRIHSASTRLVQTFFRSNRGRRAALIWIVAMNPRSLDHGHEAWSTTLDALDEVMRDVRVVSVDCGSLEGMRIVPDTQGQLRERLAGCAGTQILSARDGETDLLPFGSILRRDHVALFASARALRLVIRSSLHCESIDGVCAVCYGRDPVTLEVPTIGDAVGKRSVASLRNPRRAPFRRAPEFQIGAIPRWIVSETAGTVTFDSLPEGMEWRLARDAFGNSGGQCAVLCDVAGTGDRLRLFIAESGESHLLDNETRVLVRAGQRVERGARLAYRSVAPVQGAFLSDLDELARLLEGYGRDEGTGLVPATAPERSKLELILEENGERQVAEVYLEWLRDSLALRRMEVERRHLELITAKMLSWMRVVESGDGKHPTGAILSRHEFVAINEDLLERGLFPVRAWPHFLGACAMRDAVRRRQ